MLHSYLSVVLFIRTAVIKIQVANEERSESMEIYFTCFHIDFSLRLIYGL